MGTGELLGKPNKLRGVICDRLASRPGGVEILLAASCYRNRDKLRRDEPVWLQGFTFFTPTDTSQYLSLQAHLPSFSKSLNPIHMNDSANRCLVTNSCSLALVILNRSESEFKQSSRARYHVRIFVLTR